MVDFRQTQPPLDPELSADELWQLAKDDPAVHAKIARHPSASKELLREIADTSDDRGARAAARAALAPARSLPDWQKFLIIIAIFTIIGGIFAMIVILTGDNEAAANTLESAASGATRAVAGLFG
ncbi:MAG: hypothetical protein Q4P33_00240 [Flaviflexus sp.]|nr:hypothetical protein [Flaviflexus sp.]